MEFTNSNSKKESCELLKKMMGVKSNGNGTVRTENGANTILNALSKVNPNSEALKPSLSDAEKAENLSKKLDFITNKYINNINFKVSNSINRGYTFSHIFLQRKDFQGWHTFVQGGYDQASPQKCADMFMNHLKSKGLIPNYFNWCSDDFTKTIDVTQSRGHNTIKISWDVPQKSLTTSDSDIISDEKVTKVDDIDDNNSVINPIECKEQWFLDNLDHIKSKIEKIDVIDGKVHVVFNFKNENIVKKQDK